MLFLKYCLLCVCEFMNQAPVIGLAVSRIRAGDKVIIIYLVIVFEKVYSSTLTATARRRLVVQTVARLAVPVQRAAAARSP